jgi:allantoin racemase
MRIYVINPNTSESVTDHIRRELEKIKRPDTELMVVCPAHGPVSIESAYDEALAGPPTLELVKTANDEGYDAIVLACFSDPSLDAAKEISDIPVVGIEEATMHVAAMLGHKFSITTAFRNRVPVRDMHTRLRGVDSAYASTLVLNMSVLEMDANPDKAKARILELARDAVAPRSSSWAAQV